MSDPYLDKVAAQRAQEDLEMSTCPDCLFMTTPSRSLHISSHRTAVEVKQEAPVYTHENMPGEYAYKSKGVAEGEKMHPSYRPPKEK